MNSLIPNEDKQIPILYSTQTGNSLHLSNLTTVLSNRFMVYELDSFDIKTINNHHLIIFIVSTHGDGNSPFKGSEFYRICTNLKNISTENCSSNPIFNFNFIILALGDSSFSKYNYFGKSLCNLLQSLGANLIFKEYSNEMDLIGMYDGYCRFIKGLIKNIESMFITLSIEICYNMEKDDNREILKLLISSQLNNSTNFTNSPNNSLLHKYKVIKNEEVSKDNNLYELMLEFSSKDSFVIPGNCISILPSNIILPDIDEYFSYLNEEEKKVFFSNIDLCSIPYWAFFVGLAVLMEKTDGDQNLFGKEYFKVSNREIYKEKIREISEDYNLYYDYVKKDKRTLLEVLKDFKLKPIFILLMTVTSRLIMERYYSVAMTSDRTISVLYNLNNIKTSLIGERRGLCSNFIKEKLTVNTLLETSIIHYDIFLGSSKILLFCTGSGYSVARSILKHCIHGNIYKNIILYYGCRYNDFNLPEGEISGYNKYFNKEIQSEIINEAKLYKAVSREGRKEYIMDAFIRENRIEDIDDWLIIVGGHYRLNKEIRELFRKVYNRTIPFQSETW